ncbi:MAG: cyclase family protein [Bacteroidia bacterium]|jgi:kynurenine formamidase|nr:cyclase family protein [Bacteroidia bacterium]
MRLIIEHNGKTLEANLANPISIAIPLQSGNNNPNAFGIQAPQFTPYQSGGFIGSVSLGGSVNCENLLLNAHGNGTHTECIGHITNERFTINQSLKTYLLPAQVVSVKPTDNCIQLDAIQNLLLPNIQALVIRTLPNTKDKLHSVYSGNNPPYLSVELCGWLAQQGIEHLLVDLPSVDPEMDEGLLQAHHAFWQYPYHPRVNATITEMIYVPNEIEDGLYILQHQIAPIESDASPSKPILYPLQ